LIISVIFFGLKVQGSASLTQLLGIWWVFSNSCQPPGNNFGFLIGT